MLIKEEFCFQSRFAVIYIVFTVLLEKGRAHLSQMLQNASLSLPPILSLPPCQLGTKCFSQGRRLPYASPFSFLHYILLELLWKSWSCPDGLSP